MHDYNKSTEAQIDEMDAGKISQQFEQVPYIINHEHTCDIYCHIQHQRSLILAGSQLEYNSFSQ